MSFSAPSSASKPFFPLTQWFLLAALFFLAVIGAWVFFVYTPTGQLIDAVTWETAAARLQEVRTPVRAFLNVLPEAVAVCAGILWVILTLVKRRFKAAVIALAVFALTNASAQALKYWIFSRPDLGTGIPYYTGNSLPSGHTSFATAAGFALVLVAVPRARATFTALATVLACAVGAGTFLETWHRPADMLAAYFLAGGWALLGAGLLARWDQREAQLLDQQYGDDASFGWFLITLGALITTLSLFGFWQAGGISTLHYPFSAFSLWHYVAGLCLSVGPGVLTYGVVLLRINTARPVRALNSPV